MGSVRQQQRELEPGADQTQLLAKVSSGRRALTLRQTRPTRLGAKDLNTKTQTLRDAVTLLHSAELNVLFFPREETI